MTLNMTKWFGGKGRYDLSRVHVQGGYEYATDGRQLVRCKTQKQATDPTGAPDIHDKWREYAALTTDLGMVMPTVPEPQPVVCDTCKGSGYTRHPDTVACPWCDGEGEFETPDEAWYDCCKCDGEGTITRGHRNYADAVIGSDAWVPCAKGDSGAVPCDECDATGRTREVVRVDIAGVMYDAWLLHNVPRYAVLSRGPDDALLWRTATHEGLVPSCPE